MVNEQLAADGWSIKAECLDSGGYDLPSKWQVTLSYNGKSYAVVYQQGSAHRVWKARATDYWAPYAKRNRPEEFARLADPLVPTLADVLFCLVSDASSVRYGQGFAEWCQEFGESEDSRRAHKAYKGCIKDWRGLVRLGANLDTLAMLFQDY